MATSEYTNIETGRKVITRNIVALKTYLKPDPIIYCDTGFRLFSAMERRNIMEEKNTTEKNQSILRKVISKGDKGYIDFKERLRQTKQYKLLELVRCAEKGIDTKHILDQLEMIALNEEKLQLKKSTGFGSGAQIFTPKETYQERKKELQGDLINLYRNKYNSITLSPLLEEVDTPLEEFYVRPDIVVVKQKSLTSDEEEKTPVKCLMDIFATEREYQNEIYLSADAGFGKTSFSKYLAITWCQAHAKSENYKYFKTEEVQALSDFEFLFLVLLRDSTNICSIENMIEQQLFEHLPSTASLEEVLRQEKCLIILDGLDEWTHPDKSCPRRNEKIPHRYSLDNCVILTTVRPWKLGVCKLKTSQINKKIELIQLSEESTQQLEENAVRKMTGALDDIVLQSKLFDLKNVIQDHGLQQMRSVPLLLMYIICLLCNKIPIGNSKYEVYANIIEFLLSRAVEKHPEVQASCESNVSDFPNGFRKHKLCKMFYPLISSLSELAYQTLFNEIKENTLVFDRSFAEKYLKADDMKLSFSSGILSECRTTTMIKEISKVSFFHKTLQEFFAAIFINSNSEAQKTVLNKSRNIQDILDMSLIFEFLSNMNASLMCSILKSFPSVINEDAITRSYRTRKGRQNLSDNPLYNIQTLLLSCLKGMPDSRSLCLQDFFINNDSVKCENLQLLSKQNKTNIKSLYIDISYTSSSSRDIVDLFSLTDLKQIQKLYYDGDNKKAEIDLFLFPSLQNLNLSFSKLTNDENNFCDKLALIQNLHYLHIEYITLSHKILEAMFEFISSKNFLKELTLSYLACEEHDHDCKRLNLDLSQHTNLTKVYLNTLPMLQLNTTTPSLEYITLCDINVEQSSVLLSPHMLNIERVKMTYIKMTAGCLQNFITVLDYLPQSVTVTLYVIRPETEYRRVRGIIRSSKNFDVIPDDEDYRGFVFKTRKPTKLSMKITL